MTHLFDTDVLIFHLKDHYILPITPDMPPAISVITYAELLYGVEKSKNPKRRTQLEALLQDLRMVILPVTPAIIARFIALKIQLETDGEKLADFDLLIAATAMEHNLTLITGNKKHFSRIPGLSLA
ncbi:MAG: type II toxin-antitoxin system VapC family toxin [Candidatus Gottesmanbacteria bacterium]|nr:type II toxin-antitoxin system VapC family toxin [Candidatus Gottesmanbacteria bacterium]